MMATKKSLIWLILFVGLGINISLFSQLGVGKFRGRVLDELGQPVNGAVVIAEFLGNPPKGKQAIHWRVDLYRTKALSQKQVIAKDNGRWFMVGIGSGYWRIHAILNDKKSTPRLLKATQSDSHVFIVRENDRYVVRGELMYGIPTQINLYLFNKFHEEKSQVLLLIQAGRLNKAIQFCKNLKGEKKAVLYFFLSEKLYKERIEKWFIKERLDLAESFGKDLPEERRKDFYHILANFLAEKKVYEKALKYFQIADIHSAKRAEVHGLWADQLSSQGNTSEAKINYQLAVQEYNRLIKTWWYQWQGEDQNKRRRFQKRLHEFKKTAMEEQKELKLNQLLQKSRHYCSQLKNTFLHFLCYEEITEITSTFRKRGFPQKHIIVSQDGKIKIKSLMVKRNKMIYDYRLINQDGEIKETRALIKRQDRKKVVEESSLLTNRYHFKKIIYGPLELLSKAWQNFYDYELLKDEKTKGDTIWIIDAVPRTLVSNHFLFGKIWVKEKPFQILKIEWNPRSLYNYRQVMEEDTSADYSEPYITYFTEFKIFKKGVSFPSRNYLEIGYRDESGNRYVKLLANVLYKDYIFHQVGTKVQKETLK